MFTPTSYQTAAHFLNNHHPGLNGDCSNTSKSVPSTVIFAMLPLSHRNQFSHFIWVEQGVVSYLFRREIGNTCRTYHIEQTQFLDCFPNLFSICCHRTLAKVSSNMFCWVLLEEKMTKVHPLGVILLIDALFPVDSKEKQPSWEVLQSALWNSIQMNLVAFLDNMPLISNNDFNCMVIYEHLFFISVAILCYLTSQCYISLSIHFFVFLWEFFEQNDAFVFLHWSRWVE